MFLDNRDLRKTRSHVLSTELTAKTSDLELIVQSCTNQSFPTIFCQAKLRREAVQEREAGRKSR